MQAELADFIWYMILTSALGSSWTAVLMRRTGIWKSGKQDILEGIFRALGKAHGCLHIYPDGDNQQGGLLAVLNGPKKLKSSL